MKAINYYGPKLSLDDVRMVLIENPKATGVRYPVKYWQEYHVWKFLQSMLIIIIKIMVRRRIKK